MADTTTVFDKRIGSDRFEIARISYEGVGQASGFQRRKATSRPQYKINGVVVSRAVFFAKRDAASKASVPP